jgi:hypothetical protein
VINVHRTDVGLILLTSLVSLFTGFLAVIGEQRPDAYVAVSILIYFVYTAIDSSIRKRSRTILLDLILISIFALITTYRVLSVLGVT